VLGPIGLIDVVLVLIESEDLIILMVQINLSILYSCMWFNLIQYFLMF